MKSYKALSEIMVDWRYIDSHVNLHAPQFDEDRAEVIHRAQAAGVDLMVNICDRVSNFEAVYAVAEQHENMWATVGTHPMRRARLRI